MRKGNFEQDLFKPGFMTETSSSSSNISGCGINYSPDCSLGQENWFGYRFLVFS